MGKELEKFKGIFMAMYSAYDDNGNVDKERVKKLARYYADKKVKGLYVGGSSGEGVLQSEEERKQVVEAVMEEVKGELTIIVHVGANSTPESVRLAQHAEKVVNSRSILQTVSSISKSPLAGNDRQYKSAFYNLSYSTDNRI